MCAVLSDLCVCVCVCSAQMTRGLLCVFCMCALPHSPRHHSGGMRRRLSVAVALVGDPEIVFLDEPSTGLDPDSRRQLWEVLLRVREEKILILTTHSMEEADVLCTRCVLPV